jgi:thiol-disulfide isomerase/thioredoxin
VVSAIGAQLGDNVATGGTTAAVTVANTTTLALHGTVGEAEVANLKLGQVATLSVDAVGIGTRLTGKVTVIDFYAVWCAPCRKIDAHLFPMLGPASDIAVRKINVVDWDSPVAKRYLNGVTALPYVVVFGKKGQRVRPVSGLDLKGLDKAIAEGRRP